MARHEDKYNDTTDYTKDWKGETGDWVEDAVTKALNSHDKRIKITEKYKIDSLEYTSDNKLIIHQGDNEQRVTIEVLPSTYNYGIYIYALQVDNGSLIFRGQDVQNVQFNKDKTYKLGVAVFSTVSNKNTTDRDVYLPIKFTYGDRSFSTNVKTTPSEYFDMDSTGAVKSLRVPENSEDVVKWIEVSELFVKTYTNGYIKATITPDAIQSDSTKVNGVYTDTFTTPITLQVISLKYDSTNYYTNSSSITFTVQGGTGNYKLEGLNRNSKITSSGLTVNLNSGLNQLIVRAISTASQSIYTNWYYLDIIYTEGCTDTVMAINKVSDSVSNNAISTLYDLTVYSPSKDSLTVTTYLSDNDPGTGTPNPNTSDVLETRIIEKESYNSDYIYNSTYYKYIETLSTTSTYKYLMVKGNSWYTFNDIDVNNGELDLEQYSFKTLTIDPVNEDFCYVRDGVKYNFDQITGRINNVFVTSAYAPYVGVSATIPDNIEVGDGWQDNAGITSFKISAQEQSILNLNDLNLGNEFSLELKFKTYNISDETQPILTFGDIQLLPTQLTYDAKKTTQELRNSIFRSDTDIHLLITVKKDFTIKKGELYYPDYMINTEYEKSSQEEFDKAMAETNSTTNKFNLVRIFINGCIDREYILTNNEFQSLQKASIIINPTTSDIDFYIFRLYNQNALDFTQVQKNYISSLMNNVALTDDTPKQDFFDKNDILDDSTGAISFAKAYKKYNTIVLVFPKDPKYPNRTNYVPTRAWGGKDNSDPHLNDNLATTIFINYADATTNATYGGRLTGARVRGQGTSAMRYWIWNPATHLTKAKKYKEDGNANSGTEDVKSTFIPNSYLDTETNTFKPEAEPTVTKGYYMPGDSKESGAKVKKAVGKVNYASSMQNHKIGFTDLYNYYYKEKFSSIKVADQELGGNKAVKEEPFLYFYVNASDYDVSNWQLADVLNAVPNFMGFLTWGSGKGDNETFAIDDDRTPGYLFLEGGENSDIAVQFRVPWQALQRNVISWNQLSDPSHTQQSLDNNPTIDYEDSLKEPWDRLWISGDESIIYDPSTADTSGAWDVNAGLEEINNDFRFAIENNEYLQESIKTWRTFYDFVYTHDWDIDCDSRENCADWDINKKHCCTANKCNVDIKVGAHAKNDVYRYDNILNKWVRAGVSYDLTNEEWDSYNLLTNTNCNNVAQAKKYLRDKFKNNIAYSTSKPTKEGVLDTNDANIHQAMIRLLAGTDNRAKNTYFRITGPVLTKTEVVDSDGNAVLIDGKEQYTWEPPSDYSESKRKYHYVTFLQDDVDTILATDNNGLQSKDYNLMEPSYYNDKSESKLDEDNNETDPELSAIGKWGEKGKNVFFKCYDLAFENDIISELSKLIERAFNNSKTASDKSNNFYKYFFNIQDSMFPAVAYNHTAKIYYELGQLIYNNKNKVIPEFTGNNGVDPITQSHGSCIESELSFMEKRLRFLATQAENYKLNSLSLNKSGSGSSVVNLNMKLNYTTYMDFYPLLSQTGQAYLQDNGNNDSFTSVNFDYLDTTSRNRLASSSATEPYTMYIKNEIDNNYNDLVMMDQYKTLEIYGLQSSSMGTNVSYDHLTSLTIDNSDSEYTSSAFTDNNWIPNFPVAKTINLKNMNLPTTLDFSNCTKLETLDLTGSSIEKVILPSSGHLKTVILPNSITNLVITNNPNLETLTCVEDDEDSSTWSNLTTLDINCNKTGSKFDLTGFLHQLIDAPKLANVTLSGLTNQNINIKLLQKLLLLNAKLTGSIKIVEEGTESNEGTLYAIDLTTKSNLAYTYGNIDSESNSIYINYETKNITDLTYDFNLYVFGKGYKGNIFGITASGNNVKLIECNSNSSQYSGKYIPDIEYNWAPVNKVATLDKQTGEVEMLVDESDKTTTADFILTKMSGDTIRKTGIAITFKWVAPQMGDFVYADGTYASSYKTSSTLVGIVYAVDDTESIENETEYTGTAYILGTDWSNLKSYMLGYTQGATNNSTDTTMKNLFYVQEYLKEIGIDDSYYSIDQSNTKTPGIIKGYMNNIPINEFDGKDRTYTYIKKSNSVLKQLYSKLDLQKYIEYTPSTDSSDGTYVIKDLDSLGSLVNYLQNVSKDTTYIPCILYPYFQEVYLYQPNVKSGETLNSQFKAGNWYVPSAMELGYLMYCKGVSTERGINFLYDHIDRDISINSTSEYAIYSIAYKKGYNWDPKLSNLFSNYYASSTCGANGDGCYQYYNSNYYGQSDDYSWNAPYPTSYDYYSRYAHYRTTSKIPIHCVQFKYQKQTTSN